MYMKSERKINTALLFTDLKECTSEVPLLRILYFFLPKLSRFSRNSTNELAYVIYTLLLPVNNFCGNISLEKYDSH